MTPGEKFLSRVSVGFNGRVWIVLQGGAQYDITSVYDAFMEQLDAELLQTPCAHPFLKMHSSELYDRREPLLGRVQRLASHLACTDEANTPYPDWHSARLEAIARLRSEILERIALDFENQVLLKLTANNG